MIGESDDTASVDLSVALFAAVLAMVAFVAFAITRTLPTPPTETINQLRASVDVTPPGWRGVPLRGQFAFYSEAHFVLLDLTDIALSAIDPRHHGVDEDTDFSILDAGRAPSPRVFSLRIVINASAPPEAWVRFSTFLESDLTQNCPDEINRDRPLFVYVPRDEADIGPLLRYLAACRMTANLRPIPPKNTDGTTSMRLELNAGSFTIEALFR